MNTLFQLKAIALLSAILAVLTAVASVLTHRESERRAHANEAVRFQQRVVQKMNQKIPAHLHLP